MTNFATFGYRTEFDGQTGIPRLEWGFWAYFERSRCVQRFNHDKPFISTTTAKCDVKLNMMKEPSRGRRAGSHTESVLLLLLGAASPAVIGFQYLEWFNSNHLYFEISAPIWTLLYSDFYPEIWGITVFPNVLILAARVLFVSGLITYNRAQLRLGVLAASGVLLIVIEIYICFMMMTVNSVFGITPGVLMLFPAPDLELRLFVPVPMLLLAGLYLVRKRRKSVSLED